MTYFFLAFLTGIVLRYLATLGIRSCIQTSPTDEALKRRPTYHVSVISYIMGSVLAYGSVILGLSILTKNYLL